MTTPSGACDPCDPGPKLPRDAPGVKPAPVLLLPSSALPEAPGSIERPEEPGEGGTAGGGVRVGALVDTDVLEGVMVGAWVGLAADAALRRTSPSRLGVAMEAADMPECCCRTRTIWGMGGGGFEVSMNLAHARSRWSMHTLPAWVACMSHHVPVRECRIQLMIVYVAAPVVERGSSTPQEQENRVLVCDIWT